MAGVTVTEIPRGGFSFELTKRSAKNISDSEIICGVHQQAVEHTISSVCVCVCLYVCRNEALRRAGLVFPKAVKTGTTIAGIVFKVCNSSLGISRIN